MKIPVAGIYLVLWLISLIGLLAASSIAVTAIVAPIAVMLLTMAIITGGQGKTFELSFKSRKLLSDAEAIKELESELGIGGSNEYAWMDKYALPEGWKWVFLNESVEISVLGKVTETNSQIGIYAEGNGKTMSLASNTVDDSRWVNPIPIATFQRRFESRVARTYESVMEHIEADKIIKSLTGRK